MAALAGLLCVSAACGPRIARIDDKKLAGIPEERMADVQAAKNELTLAKAELAKAQEAEKEAGFRLRISRAALAVAEARAEHAGAEFALAKFQNVNAAIVRAGEAQSAEDLAVRRATGDVDVARAGLVLAQRKAGELEHKITLLEARHELERAKVALRYDGGSPNEKSVALSEYERGVLEAELAWKDADTKLRQAAVELDTAKAVRASLDAVK